MMKDFRADYWEILNMAEDLIKGGWRRPAASIHPLPEISPGTAEVMPEVQGAGQAVGSAANTADTANTVDSMEKIAAEIFQCRKCRLGELRHKPVPGEGPANPKLIIIGEAPGAQEDATGKPFVGRAGQYLDKWLKAIDLDRERDVFIGNIIKCRPPNNRDPFPDETSACMPYQKRQLALMKPKAILTLGRISTHLLTGTVESIGKLHGKEFSFEGIPLIPTYHPSGVLRNPAYRKPVWDDLRTLRRILDRGDD
jgi:DNA polymerase